MPIRPRYVIPAIVVAFGLEASAQRADSTAWHPDRGTRHMELCLHTGYDQGRHGSGELGLSANVWGSGRHPYGVAAYAATEVRLDRPRLLGPKVGIFITGGFALGAQAIYYTDATEGSFVLRPEYGFGLFKFKLTYGYNFRITNKDMPGLNSHVAAISYAFRLLRLRGDDAFGGKRPR